MRPGLASLVGDIVTAVDAPPTTAVFPAVDRQTWSLDQARLERWDGAQLRVARVVASPSWRLSLERVLARGEFQPDVAGFLASFAISDLGALRSKAFGSRADALQSLANSKDPRPAQNELLRLANVGETVGALLSDPDLLPGVTRELTELGAACDAATATMSASLTAALLASQYHEQQTELERRGLLEQGQRRLAATAAALVLPTIVVGYAGANFVAPAPEDRWWAALATAGGAILAAVLGIALAFAVSKASPKAARGYLAGSGDGERGTLDTRVDCRPELVP